MLARGGVAGVRPPLGWHGSVNEWEASLAASLTYRQANPLHRALRRLAATGPGSWFFARVLHHIDRPIYRLTGGRHMLSTLVSGLPVVMLTTTGARSGAERTVPVVGLPTPDCLAVIASNYGQAHHPSWYYNLRANPQCYVTVNGVRSAFSANEAEGDARARIWQEALSVYPGFSEYERRASHRHIGVFVLETT
jgi:deazaflavin-dependent oxidoreductase (nitroreductase family)